MMSFYQRLIDDRLREYQNTVRQICNLRSSLYKYGYMHTPKVREDIEKFLRFCVRDLRRIRAELAAMGATTHGHGRRLASPTNR